MAFGCSHFGLHDAVALEDGSSNTESKAISVSEPLVVNAELADTRVAASPSAGSSAASRRDASAEGIGVHGHWTIEVRDPDGTLVERREFENDLQPTGDTIIINLMGRQRTPSIWSVRLEGGCLLDTDPTFCEVVEPASASSFPNVFKNLTVAVSGTDNQADTATLTLSGVATAQRDGSVTAVRTSLSSCAPSFSPEVCGATEGSNWLYLTHTTLSESIPVVTGQSIQVSVAITVS
jgi:hypothetical protein